MIDEKDISIVIPSWNEGGRTQQVVDAIRKLKINLPLVIVDDGSTLPTQVTGKNISLLRHPLNLGKGAALKTGAEYAFKVNKSLAVIFMDADGQHSPQDLPKFIEALKSGYDLLLGCRQLSNNVPLIRLIGNKFSSVYLNLIFRVYVSDTLSGFRAMSKHGYSKVKWRSSSYGVEPEMIANLGKHKNDLQYKEIEIETIYHDKYKGVTIIDALQILLNSLWWKLS